MSSINNISNSNLSKAINNIKFHKALKKTFNESPAQTKVLIALVLTFLIGLPFYSFLSNNPLWQIIGYLIVSIILSLIVYSFTNSTNEKWVVFMSLLVGIFFWLYIFINNYRKTNKEKNVGKKSFICSPNGICKTDGTQGPYNGMDDYVFNPPDYPGKKEYRIPERQFDIRVSDRFTYMFWLKINYKEWKEKRFYNKDKIILMKGQSLDNSDLAVWALQNENAIQFDVNAGDNSKIVSLSVGFPFDRWVHYSIVVNGKVVELYKNATLEQTAILDKVMSLRRTPLYLGKTPGEPTPGKQKNTYKKFPGQMLYLSYNNDNLTPGEIYDIYKSEYSKVSNMSMDLHVVDKKIPDNCSENCTNENIDSVLKSTNNLSFSNNENTIPHLKEITFNDNKKYLSSIENTLDKIKNFK